MKRQAPKTEREKRIHSLIVRPARTITRRYPCPVCNKPNKLTLKQSLAAHPCDRCTQIQ